MGLAVIGRDTDFERRLLRVKTVAFVRGALHDIAGGLPKSAVDA